jgi:glycerol-3-phosphate dehydrogenase
VSEPSVKQTRSAGPAPAAVDASCDVLVVGGGINGAGIARDLAGRGLRVLLCEKDDIAQHTSSASTKLIHGGLRYLEYYEFSLVRKALIEREVLLRSAPHIMRPLRFVMPHDRSLRPVWMIRLGLFLYDHLARREVLPGSATIDLRRHEAGQPLKPAYTKGFVYSDGWVDDARLVVLNLLDAQQRGARILTRTRCIEARRCTHSWQAVLEGPGGQRTTVSARALVNAAGPWTEQFLREQARQHDTRSLRLVKGSHIVVRRMFDHPMAYIFQNPDKRIIFAIPYEQDYTLIGTTDVEHRGPVGQAQIDDSEIAYLCEQASRYFARPVTREDVVWTYSGVRPLLDDASGDPSAVTRDYLLELSAEQAGDDGQRRPAAPLLSVWGGKITTFRKLAEEAADLLCPALRHPSIGWTRHETLPGGDLSAYIGAPQRPDADFERFDQALAARHPWLPATLRRRLARCYGSRVDLILGRAQRLSDLGEEVAPQLYEAELHYLGQHEWARTGDDVLWRRTKLGLHMGPPEREAVARWFERAHETTQPVTLAAFQR